MKWMYSIKNKMMASAALFTLCLLALFSNYVSRDHSSNVKKSISTLYEDRLVVEDYILKMTIDIYKIKETLMMADAEEEHSAHRIKALLSDIDGLSDAYLKTKFTKTEDVKFTILRKTLSEFELPSLPSVQSKLEIANRSLILLNELSSIQLDESKLIIKQSENLYRSGKVLSQLAFAVMIIILLVLQALIFTSKSLTHHKQASPPHLN